MHLSVTYRNYSPITSPKAACKSYVHSADKRMLSFIR